MLNIFGFGQSCSERRLFVELIPYRKNIKKMLRIFFFFKLIKFKGNSVKNESAKKLKAFFSHSIIIL